jgi:hypothetical protein
MRVHSVEDKILRVDVEVLDPLGTADSSIGVLGVTSFFREKSRKTGTS